MVTRLAFTVREAAELLSISRSSLYELIHAGSIQSVKIGRSRRLTEEHLRVFLAGQELPNRTPSRISERLNIKKGGRCQT